MEKIDKAIEILQAFKEGKCLEYKINSGSWCDWTGVPTHLFTNGYEYRIKLQPTYRPYANAEEFLKASKEHGCIKIAGDFITPVRVTKEGVWFIQPHYTFEATIGRIDYYNLFHAHHTFQDGTPCGILEQ